MNPWRLVCRLWFLPALVAFDAGLAGCQQVCLPGSMTQGAGGFQNLLFPVEPVVFRFDEGSCGLPPSPAVHVSGPDGQKRTGTVSLRSYRGAGTEKNVVEATVFFEPFEGANVIELEFGNGLVRSGTAFFVRPVDRPEIATIEGQCTGSLRFDEGAVSCNALRGTGAAVWELSDAGLVALDGSLWVTAEGSIVTTAAAEIGWWTAGTRLADWRPTAALTGRPMLVSASGSIVALWQSDSTVVILSRDLSQELARIPVRECDSWCELAAAMVMTERGVLLSRRGDHQLLVEDGGWSILPEEVPALPLATGWGNQFWRCSDRNIEVGNFDGNGLRVVATAEAPLSCGGWPGSASPAIAGGRSMLLCPRLSDGGIEWQSVALRGNESGGGCFFDHAYTFSTGVPVRTRIVELQ